MFYTQASTPTRSRLSAANTGFSLVELSIVLVILGLLTGGILTGQSLVRAAELRSVSVEVQGFITAVSTFKQRYSALPGDMSDAEEFWTAAATDNGDGDRRIEETAGSGNDESESFMFWNQLALAGMINGEYTGFSGASSDGVLPGENTPLSELDGGIYQMVDRDNTDGTGGSFQGNYSNTLLLGVQDLDNGSDWAGNPFTPPEDAWNIDTKMDDGSPSTGLIMSNRWNNNCINANGTASSTNLDATYNLISQERECALYFKNIFD